MNINNTEDIFWLGKDGEQVLIKDMKPEELQETLQKIQVRQLEAVSTLEMVAKLENAVRVYAKEKKVKLKEFDEIETKKEVTQNRYVHLKDRIKSVNRNIKIQLKKNEQPNQILLQETEH